MTVSLDEALQVLSVKNPAFAFGYPMADRDASKRILIGEFHRDPVQPDAVWLAAFRT